VSRKLEAAVHNAAGGSFEVKARRTVEAASGGSDKYRGTQQQYFVVIEGVSGMFQIVR